VRPSLQPSTGPSVTPTIAPSSLPSFEPTTTPTLSPTPFPTTSPSISSAPSSQPTDHPSSSPTTAPTTCIKDVMQASRSDSPLCDSVSLGYNVLDYFVMSLMFVGFALPVIGIIFIDCGNFIGHFGCIILTLLDTFSDLLYLLTADFANPELFWLCVGFLIWSFLYALPLAWTKSEKVRYFEIVLGFFVPLNLLFSLFAFIGLSAKASLIELDDIVSVIHPRLEMIYLNYSQFVPTSPFSVALPPDEAHPYRAYYNPLNIIWDTIVLLLIPSPLGFLYLLVLFITALIIFILFLISYLIYAFLFLLAFECRMLSPFFKREENMSLQYENYEYLVELCIESLPMFFIQIANQSLLHQPFGGVAIFCLVVTCLKIGSVLMHYGFFWAEGEMDLLQIPTARYDSDPSAAERKYRSSQNDRL
jgi:hypothetical protein